MDDNLLIPQQLDDVQADIKANIKKEKEKEQLIASVVATPAWEEVKKLMENKGSNDAICERLRPLITDVSVTNEELGAIVRSTFMSAKDISETLEQVMAVVKAHEK